MRKFTLVLGLLLFLPAVWGADARPVITREAGRYAAAWKRSDHQAIVSFLPAPMLRPPGRRAALMNELKNQFAQARSLGVQELDATLGPPSAPKQIGRWLASVLSVTAVLHSAHLDLTQQTHVLALSADQGKQWSFLLLYEMSQDELNTWFPEFRGKVFVPTPPEPQLKLVY